MTRARASGATRELGAGEHPGQRDPDDQGDAGGGEGAGEAQAQGVGDDRAGRGGRRGRSTARAAAARRTGRPGTRRRRRRAGSPRRGDGRGPSAAPPSPRGHAGSKPYDVEDLLALVGEHEGDERGGDLAVARVGEGGDRVGRRSRCPRRGCRCPPRRHRPTVRRCSTRCRRPARRPRPWSAGCGRRARCVSIDGVTPALASASRPNSPHGTSSAHSPISRSRVRRSRRAR